MRLSASINLFDGHELLPALLRNLRADVDHLSVVYQMMSWYGEPASIDLAPLLGALHRDGWIDEAVAYDREALPNATVKAHEARKRSIGAELGRSAGASHHLSLDVDEFYRASELRWAKQAIDRDGWDVTVCRFGDYHARPTYRCVELARFHGIDLFVPFICEIEPSTRVDAALDFFCAVDPSRRLPCRRPFVFPPDRLRMHHMTTVRGSRESLVSKFVNSSSRSIFALEDPRDLASLVRRFDPSRDGAPRVTVVADEFGIGGIG
jgi:hypothetical protein